MKLNEQQIYKTILGNILKREFAEYLIPQLEIVKRTGKSKQYVSSVFSGNATINIDFLKQLFDMLNHQVFDFNEKTLNEVNVYLDQYLIDYAFLLAPNRTEELDSFLNEKLYWSYACPEYLALKCALEYHKGNTKTLLDLICMIEQNFMESIRFRKKAYLLFLMIKAEIQTDTDQWSDALLTLQEAKEQISSSSSSSCVLGVICLYEGLAHFQLSNNIDALLSFRLAEKVLLEDRNHLRALAVSKNIASCYIQMSQFDHAEALLKSTLNEAIRLVNGK